MAEVPKTKAGKERKVARTMREFKAGDLESSSGDKVTNPKQAVVIALSQTGQSKPPAQRKSAGKSAATSRLAGELGRRLDARDKR